LLVRRELQHDFAADGFAADVGEELIGHGDVDIAFERRPDALRSACPGRGDS
jgi:hypothetical protein